MSGGQFNYDQYKITGIAYDIEQFIITNESTEISRWTGGAIGRHYPPEVVEKLRLAVHALKVAAVYAHRVDWLLSGDDAERSFLCRLESDLAELEKEVRV
jgi:hypothetical protein